MVGPPPEEDSAPACAPLLLCGNTSPPVACMELPQAPPPPVESPKKSPEVLDTVTVEDVEEGDLNKEENFFLHIAEIGKSICILVQQVKRNE